MASYNDITGNCLVTKPSTDAYRNGFDAIFAEKKKAEAEAKAAEEAAKVADQAAPEAPGEMSEAAIEAGASALENAVKAILPEFMGGDPAPTPLEEVAVVPERDYKAEVEARTKIKFVSAQPGSVALESVLAKRSEADIIADMEARSKINFPDAYSTPEEDEAWVAMAEKARQEGFIKQSEADAIVSKLKPRK